MLQISKRISWDIYESALILDMYLKIKRGDVKKSKGVVELSDFLRLKAIKKGLKIDDNYRNKNGISMQLACITYLMTDGEDGFAHGSRMYREIVQIYRNEPDKYYNILEKARRIENESAETEQF